MTFNAACKFCYEAFKKEYHSVIGTILDCGEYWIFYKKSTETDYGALPIVVYKGDKQPIPLTFSLCLELSEEIENATQLPIPKEFS